MPAQGCHNALRVHPRGHLPICTQIHPRTEMCFGLEYPERMTP